MASIPSDLKSQNSGAPPRKLREDEISTLVNGLRTAEQRYAIDEKDFLALARDAEEKNSMNSPTAGDAHRPDPGGYRGVASQFERQQKNIAALIAALEGKTLWITDERDED